MNVISNADGFKVSLNTSTLPSVRDMEFVREFRLGADYAEVWVSDLHLRVHGADVDRPNAICTLPQAVKNGPNRYYIYVSRCALADPLVFVALIAHECGHIIHKHLYNAYIRDSKYGVIRDADYEIEADRFACSLGVSDAMRKIIINGKEEILRGCTSEKYIKFYDDRLKAIDDWEASHK